MAHESFEDPEIAEILNQSFVSIKVDKEERPDIDSIYMAVCQAFTGSGGWPMSIFMDADQKPFFAGTYFPKTARYGSIGLRELLLNVQDKWQNDRAPLLRSANEVLSLFHQPQSTPPQADEKLLQRAVTLYQQSFDQTLGGFGDAPKFPTPHNLLFLLQQYQKHGDAAALQMAEKTLDCMYCGGLFDHIGYGFCRYSTDRYFLVPHFEKMLYDNALLILAYCKAYEVTSKPLYQEIAEKTAQYILSELTAPNGGFYSAQDADSDGVEGKYYVFTPSELLSLLGETDGAAFCAYYGITNDGNFEGKSIPNLLDTSERTNRFEAFFPMIRAYRKRRTSLHTDDKILTAWNALMIAALCALYRISRDSTYLTAAKRAQQLIETQLCEKDVLFVSYRDGKRSSKGFLDDYASYTFALLALYHATLDQAFLHRAAHLTEKAVSSFFDHENGGFFLYGQDNERLIFRPKESYDGAIPSGNALMAYQLVRLQHLLPCDAMQEVLQKQLRYLSGEAAGYPAGHAMFLAALSDEMEPPKLITVVKGKQDIADLPFLLSSDTLVRILDAPTEAYQLLDGQTTFYVCEGRHCHAPVTAHQFYRNVTNH